MSRCIMLLSYIHSFILSKDTSNKKPHNTVETGIKVPRFLLSSLDRFLNSGWVFLIPACKVLNSKVVIYTTCFACIYTAFSPRVFDDSWEHFKVRIPVQVSCHMFCNMTLKFHMHRQLMKFLLMNFYINSMTCII